MFSCLLCMMIEVWYERNKVLYLESNKVLYLD